MNVTSRAFRETLRHPAFLAVVALYIASAFVHFPSTNAGTNGWRYGQLVLAPPRVLSGDSPHYLVAVNSLLLDGDFDLSNNYDRALDGDLDMGQRFRGVAVDRHADTDAKGRQIGTHSPFFSLLLAAMVWPLRGTAWVEPACVLLTLLVSLLGVSLFGTAFCSPTSGSSKFDAVTFLGFVTPLWCYSRDLWTEPWIMTVWLAMLVFRSSILVGILGVLGTLLKVPFAAVPLAMAWVAFREGNRNRAYLLLASAFSSLVVSITLVQYLFSEVDHFAWFHSGIHAGFGWPFDGFLGLLMAPQGGLLLFFPFLAWGVPYFREKGVYLPALAFYLVHAFYDDWAGGTGFSSRYLVPMLPFFAWGVMKSQARGRLFQVAFWYSLFWGAFAGLFPALVYDRSPWAVLSHLLSHLSGRA